MADYLELPHAAEWKRSGPRPATAAGVDGGTLSDPVEVAAFFEPLTPKQAESRFGVTGVQRPYFAMFDPEEVPDLREEDVMVWEEMNLTVKWVKYFSFEDARTLEALVSATMRSRPGA